MTARSVALVIPAHNEAETIGAVVREALPYVPGEVIVVDNGSTDATAEVARAAGARVVAQPNPGYGRACIAGYAATTAKVVVFMDGDGSDQPEDIPALLAAIEAGADLALAVRRGPRVQPGAIAPAARFGNWLATTLLAARYGSRLHDLSPLKAARHDLLDRIEPRELTYGWTVELLGRALELRASITEIDTGYRHRAGGASKVSGDLRASVRAGVRILAVIARLAMRRRRRTASTGARVR